MGFVAWIAASADATTTGAVAVSPPGPVTWRQRDHVPVLVDARDVLPQRFPGDAHWRGGRTILPQRARQDARVLGGEEIDGGRIDP